MNISERLAATAARYAARYYLKRPDQEELIRIKFPNLRSVWRLARNELAFRRRTLDAPFLTSVNIEVTNTCNLRCTICPVNNGMKRPKAFLDFEVFRKIIDENPGLDFILPFQWGEPLLHPQIFEMIEYANRAGVRTMITTNGTLFTEEKIEKIVQSPLTRITFSIDGDDESHERIRGFPLKELERGLIALKKRRDETGSKLRIDASMVIDAETEPHFEAYRQRWEEIVDRLQAIPKFESKPRTRTCREPWRGSIVVLANGDVTVCCADYEGDAVFGNVRDSSLEELWNGETMREFRRRHRDRDFPDLCANCGEYDTDVVSPRFS
ncbi:MAG: radical SAM protein [Planctomycetota bacterium]